MGAMNGYNTGLRSREALERLKLGNAAYVNGQHFGDLSDARRLDTAEHGPEPLRGCRLLLRLPLDPRSRLFLRNRRYLRDPGRRERDR